MGRISRMSPVSGINDKRNRTAIGDAAIDEPWTRFTQALGVLRQLEILLPTRAIHCRITGLRQDGLTLRPAMSFSIFREYTIGGQNSVLRDNMQDFSVFTGARNRESSYEP